MFIWTSRSTQDEHTRKGEGGGGRGERGGVTAQTKRNPVQHQVASLLKPFSIMQQQTAEFSYQIYISTEWGGVGVNGALNMI